MAKKVYAIKEGFDFEKNIAVKDIIVDTWNECIGFTRGVKGAKYKSFEDRDEALAFLSTPSKMLKKGIDSYPMNCLHIYVDGSYYEPTNSYSYGLVAVKNEVIEYLDGGSKPSNPSNNIRQIAGELLGALKGVHYAIQKGEKQVVIFHDYEGISHHATGYWERRDESSKYYYKTMNELMSTGIEIIFVKVDSHTGDFYNEMADEICKFHLSIPSDNVVKKWLRSNPIKVSSESIMSNIIDICSTSTNNIIVAECCQNEEILATNKRSELIKTITSSLDNATLDELLTVSQLLQKK